MDPVKQLFDADFYLSLSPDVRHAGIDPLAHFLSSGATEGRRPHPLFDTYHYLEFHPRYEDAWANPFAYYLTHDALGGPDPHPLFSTKHYLEQCPELKATRANPLLHYLQSGAAAGLDPHPLFRSSYYAAQCPQGVNPLAHWVRYGVEQLLNPHPLFDTAWYLSQTNGTDGLNPLVHCYSTNSSPHPLFHSAFYRERNPEVKMNAVEHYLTLGATEGRDPHAFFNTRYYARQCGAGVNPLVDYVLTGKATGLRPQPDFPANFPPNWIDLAPVA